MFGLKARWEYESVHVDNSACATNRIFVDTVIECLKLHVELQKGEGTLIAVQAGNLAPLG